MIEYTESMPPPQKGPTATHPDWVDSAEKIYLVHTVRLVDDANADMLPCQRQKFSILGLSPLLHGSIPCERLLRWDRANLRWTKSIGDHPSFSPLVSISIQSVQALTKEPAAVATSFTAHTKPIKDVLGFIPEIGNREE